MKATRSYDGKVAATGSSPVSPVALRPAFTGRFAFRGSMVTFVVTFCRDSDTLPEYRQSE